MSAAYGPVTQWLAGMPKAELHLHIDGSLRAPRLLQLAEKHGVELPYASVEEVEAAYDFQDLQSKMKNKVQGGMQIEAGRNEEVNK